MNYMKFKKIFRISEIALRLTRFHPAELRNLVWKVQSCTLISMLVVCFFWLSNSVLNYDIPAKNYAEASKNFIMVTVCIVILFKVTTLIYYKEGILELIRIIDRDYELAQHFIREERDIVVNYSNRGAKVCMYWLMSNSLICTIFPGKSLILMAVKCYQGQPEYIPVFDFTYPSFIQQYRETAPVFWFQFFLCLTFDCYANCYYIGFDPLVPIFLLHTCGQLELASRRLMTLFSESPSDEQLNEHLNKIIVHLQHLNRFVENVQKYFLAVLEFNMKTSTFLIPLVAFQIAESFRNDRVINVEFMGLFVGTFFSFFMPSYYSDVLMETSNRLREAIYMSGWEKHYNLRTRKHLLFMHTKASVPLVIRTVFYPICLDTFAEMCKTGYTIFNLMNAAFT